MPAAAVKRVSGRWLTRKLRAAERDAQRTLAAYERLVREILDRVARDAADGFAAKAQPLAVTADAHPWGGPPGRCTVKNIYGYQCGLREGHEGNLHPNPLDWIGEPPYAAVVYGVTAAAGDPAPWSVPFPNQVVDVDALVNEITARSRPVREAAVKAAMLPALDGVGLSFDVTNPLVGRMLAQSGSQITEIAETTQLNAMRIISAAYERGLSIPDTAKAIQSGMLEASPARARLIARTELVGVVNGGSLAAVQLVGEATGVQYVKVWMTAPGAQYPRHELYEGLDGQAVGLDEKFSVGDDELDHPGDPDGSPDEICNCRCTMRYDESEGGE